MAVRRFVYDEKADAVVEVGEVRPGVDPAARYAEERKGYEHGSATDPSPERGRRLLDAALAKADRREWAHKRYGDERRWAQ